MVVDGRAHLDLFDLDDLLFLSGFVGFFLLFVFEFAIVHQLADGRLVVGRYLNDVEAFFLAQGECLIEADLAVFVTVIADEEDGLGDNFVVDAWTILGWRRGVTLKTSGDYDSLLLLRPHPEPKAITVSRGVPASLAKRVRIMGRDCSSWPLNEGLAGRLRRPA
jgi:hypothetical protein